MMMNTRTARPASTPPPLREYWVGLLFFVPAIAIVSKADTTKILIITPKPDTLNPKPYKP